MTEHAAEIADRGPEVAVHAPGIIVRVAMVIDHVLQEADMRRAVAVHAAGIIEYRLEVSEYRSAIGRTALAVGVYAPATVSDAIQPLISIPIWYVQGFGERGSRPESGAAAGRSRLADDVDDSRPNERRERGMVEAAGVEPASESTSSWDSTCVSASLLSGPACGNG